MTLKRISNTGYGFGNRTFPIWDYGANLYWRSFDPKSVQTRGGRGIATYAYSGTAKYYMYDVGKGHFKEVNPTVAPQFPLDGCIPPARTNYFGSITSPTYNSNRGFIGFGALTKTNPVLTSSHILSTESRITDILRLSNTSGTAQRVSRQELDSATYNRAFQVLVKRTDGDVINVSNISLGISTLIGGANEAQDGITRYKKIREDGWYVLDCYHGPDSPAVNKYYWIEIPDGYEVDIEMPSLESFGTSINSGTYAPANVGENPSSEVHNLTISREDSFGAGKEGYSKSGWFGCSFYPTHNADDYILPFGVICNWEDPGAAETDFIRFSISSEALKSLSYSGNANQWDLKPATTLFKAQNYGVVVSWGLRSGTKYAFMFINGKYIDIDTVWILPAGNPTHYDIGFRAALASPLSCGLVQNIAIGRNWLSRGECRNLSKWFQNQVLSAIDWDVYS